MITGIFITDCIILLLLDFWIYILINISRATMALKVPLEFPASN